MLLVALLRAPNTWLKQGLQSFEVRLTKCPAQGYFRMSVLFHPHTTMHNEYDNDVHICMR